MVVTTDSLILTLGEESVKELKFSSTTMTEDDFNSVIDNVFKKISLLSRDCVENIFDEDRTEEDDELRNFFLGKEYIDMNVMSFLYSIIFAKKYKFSYLLILILFCKTKEDNIIVQAKKGLLKAKIRITK